MSDGGYAARTIAKGQENCAAERGPVGLMLAGDNAAAAQRTPRDPVLEQLIQKVGARRISERDQSTLLSRGLLHKVDRPVQAIIEFDDGNVYDTGVAIQALLTVRRALIC